MKGFAKVAVSIILFLFMMAMGFVIVTNASLNIAGSASTDLGDASENSLNNLVFSSYENSNLRFKHVSTKIKSEDDKMAEISIGNNI